MLADVRIGMCAKRLDKPCVNIRNYDLEILLYKSYILKLNEFLFVCLFICAELIEELAGATDLKFGMRVENFVATNKF